MQNYETVFNVDSDYYCMAEWKTLLEKTMKHEILLALIIFAVLAFASFRNVLLGEGMIQSFIDYATPTYSEQFRIIVDREISVWDKINLGNLLILPRPTAALLFFYPAYLLSMNGELFSKITFLLFTVISGFSMYLLSRRFGNSAKGSFAAGILYMFSPAAFLKLWLGQLLFYYSYCLFPLAFYFFIGEKKKDLFFSSLLFGIIGFSIQFLFIAPLVLIVYSFFNGRNNLLKNLKKILFISFAMLLINLPMLFPTFVKTDEVSDWTKNIAPSFGEQTDFVTSVFFLQGDQGKFRERVQVEVKREYWYFFAAILMTAFALGFLERKNAFLFALFVFAFFLYEFGNYSLVFLKAKELAHTNTPFFALFRDPNHFSIIAFFALSLSFASSYDMISRFLKARNFSLKPFFILLFIALFVYSFIFFTGDLGEYLINFNYPKDYRALFDFFQKDPEIYRFIWFSSSSFVLYRGDVCKNDTLFGYYRPECNDWRDFSADPMMYAMPKETVQTSYAGGSNAQKLDMFSLQAVQRTPFIGKLYGKMNMKYVLLRFNVTSNSEDAFDLSPSDLLALIDRNISEDNIRNNYKVRMLEVQKDLILVEKSENIRRYENMDFLPRIYFGRTASSSNDLNAFLVAPDYDLVFARDFQNISDFDLSGTVVLRGNSWFEFIDKDSADVLEAGDFADTTDDKKGWKSVKFFMGKQINDWELMRSPENVLYTITNKTITIPCNGERVFAKVLFHEDGTKLKFYDGSALFGEVNARRKIERFKWVEAGIKKGNDITIQGDGTNGISELICISNENYGQQKKEIIEKMKKKRVIVYYGPELEVMNYWHLNKSAARGDYIEKDSGKEVSASNTYIYTLNAPFVGKYRISVMGEYGYFKVNGKFVSNDSITELGESNVVEVVNPKWISKIIIDYGYEVSKNRKNVSFERINPTEYRINATLFGEENLVFSENYDEEWKLEKTKGNCEVLSHHTVNFYANMWRIKGDGECEFRLEYTLQKSYSIAVLVSFATVAILIACIVFFSIKKQP